MTNIAGLQPNNYRPDTTVGTGEFIQNSFLLDTIPGRFMLDREAPTFVPQPGFSYTPELWDEVTTGIAPDYFEMFRNARSPEHARWLKQHAEELQAREAKLGSWGLSGLPLRFAMGVLDPVQLGMDVGAVATTGGLALPITIAKKSERLGRALRIGAALGTSTYAGQEYINQRDPLMEDYHVMLGTALAGVLGGGLGSRIRRSAELDEVDAVIKRASDAQFAEAAKRAGDQLSEYGDAITAKPRAGDTLDREIVDEFFPEDAAERAAEIKKAAKGDAEASPAGKPDDVAVTPEEAGALDKALGRIRKEVSDTIDLSLPGLRAARKVMGALDFRFYLDENYTKKQLVNYLKEHLPPEKLKNISRKGKGTLLNYMHGLANDVAPERPVVKTKIPDPDKPSKAKEVDVPIEKATKEEDKFQKRLASEILKTFYAGRADRATEASLLAHFFNRIVSTGAARSGLSRADMLDLFSGWRNGKIGIAGEGRVTTALAEFRPETGKIIGHTKALGNHGSRLSGSSFVHEVGHFTLNMLGKLRHRSPEIAEDLEELRAFMAKILTDDAELRDTNWYKGYKSRLKMGRGKIPPPETVDDLMAYDKKGIFYDELFVMLFEQYLRDAAAPSTGIARLFEFVRRVMKDALEFGRGLRTTAVKEGLPKEITEIFDRMMVDQDVQRIAMLLGENSATADRAALQKAKLMRAGGESELKIREKTGWEYFDNMGWRYLVDPQDINLIGGRGIYDKAAAIKDGAQNVGPLTEIIDAPKLFKAYPELKNIDVRIQMFRHLEEGSSGELQRPNKVQRMAGARPQIHIWAETGEDVDMILRHEMQHAVQMLEGQNAGVVMKSKRLKHQIAYLMDPSEAEARLVESLSQMTKEQRARLLYKEVMDVDPKLTGKRYVEVLNAEGEEAFADSMRAYKKASTQRVDDAGDGLFSLPNPKWFDGSKVVNEDGSPVVVYRGAKDTVLYPGAWFTANVDEANAYTFWKDGLAAERLRAKNVEGDGADLIGKRLKISASTSEAPRDEWFVLGDGVGVFRRRSDGKTEWATNVRGSDSGYDPKTNTVEVISGSSREVFEETVRDTLEYADRYGADFKEGGNVTRAYLSIKNPLKLSAFEANRFAERLGMSREAIAKQIAEWKKQGYDGIETVSDESVLHNIKGDFRQWIIFDEDQVRPAFGKNDPARGVYNLDSLGRDADDAYDWDAMNIAQRRAAQSEAMAHKSFNRINKLPIRFDIPVLSPVIKKIAGLDQTKPLVDLGEADFTKFGGIPVGRFDMVNFVKQSKNPIMRKLGNLVMEEGVGNQGHAVSPDTAIRRLTAAKRRYEERFYKVVKGQFNADVNPKKQGTGAIYNWWARNPDKGAEDFFEEVGRAVRRPAGETLDKDVAAVADEMRKMHADVLAEAKAIGLKGFEDVAQSEQYLARLLDNQKIDGVIEKYGINAVYRLVQKAVLDANGDMDPKMAAKIAKTYVNTIRSTKWGYRSLSWLSADNRGIIERRLGELELGDIDHDFIERLMKDIDQGQEGSINRAKQRTMLNERTEMTMSDGSVLRFEDLLENNAEVIMHQYLREVLGAIEQARVLDNFRVTEEVLDTETGEVLDEVLGPRPSFDTLIENIRRTAEDYGMDPNRMEREIKVMRLFWQNVAGHSLHPEEMFGKEGSNMLQLVRDYNFVRLMNQVGFAQLAEFGTVAGMAEFKNLRGTAIFDAFKRGADGTLPDEFLSELELLGSWTTERLRRPITLRFDDFGTVEGKISSTARKAVRGMSNFTADASGMTTINQGLRALATSGIAQRWARAALAKSEFPGNPGRMHHIGWSDADWKAISAQIRKHATVDGEGRFIKRLNFSNWDPETLAKFEMGLDRTVRHVVQENDVGNLSYWMTTELGKTLIQFRTFSLSAFQKQLLHNAYNFDANTVAMWRYSMTIGALAYVAQVNMRAALMADSREYLQERLGSNEEEMLKKLAAAGFQRAGFASIIPGVWDTVAPNLLGIDPTFSYGRSTGLASDILNGNPTMDLGTSAWRAFGSPFASSLSSSYDFSQQDARAWRMIMPYQNMIGIQQWLNYLQSHPGLPRTSKDQYAQ